MQTLVVITGPTAVGKTALTIEIARHYGIPVINADSRQIYRELKIGTAAPTDEEMQMVSHYFVGSKSITDYYNASMYEQEVLSLLRSMSADNNAESLAANAHLSLLSGGSMMYIDAVCNGIDDIPTIRDDIREEMKRRYREEGLEALCEDLRRLDPEHYDIVDRQNHRRVIHALEICYQTGRTYTSFRQQAHKPRPFSIVKIGLNRDREELYNRINARVDAMMQAGFLQEAEGLYPQRSLNALNTVGYKELFDYMDGRWSLSEAVERIKGNTRRYARKQLTWFKRDPQVSWFHPDNKDEILKHISNSLSL
ncbi:MAG: tRNA (adenosine(37)-N6)-dimethylallyltransferase MiaA [Prevotella sp.]|nr:tRNA (adenosine(37)-N6)-dimethylallyltransferase MiaA [Prevotella sp.]